MYQEDLPVEIIKLFNALPGAVSQGLIWGLMAIGVYITYRILDVSDLTVDGSIATGGAVAAILIMNGWNVFAALLAAFIVGMLCGFVTGMFHTFFGIPAILSGILTQLALYSVNLRILGNKANVALSVNKYKLLLTSRNARAIALNNPILILIVFTIFLILALYWFFGTELGCAMRATGANRNMSRAQGINTDKNIVLSLMLANGIVALAGALLAQYQGFADVGMGRGDHRRGRLRQGLPQFRLQAAGGILRRDHLLYGHSGGAVAWPQHQRSQAPHGAGCGAVPGDAALAREVLW